MNKNTGMTFGLLGALGLFIPNEINLKTSINHKIINPNTQKVNLGNL